MLNSGLPPGEAVSPACQAEDNNIGNYSIVYQIRLKKDRGKLEKIRQKYSKKAAAAAAAFLGPRVHHFSAVAATSRPL